MSFQAMAWASKQKMPAAKKSLLYTLANYCGHDGSMWPSYKTLADDAGMSKRSVIKHMAEFEAAGLISKAYRRKGNGESDSNMWFLNAMRGGEQSAPPSDDVAPPSEQDAPQVVNEVHQGSDDVAPKPVTDPVSQPTNEPTEQPTPIGSGVPYQQIVDLYHTILPELPKVYKLNDKRKKHVKARWNDVLNLPSEKGMVECRCNRLEFWDRYFRHIRKLPKLMKGIDSWAGADFDFLMNETKMLKALEGSYDERERAA